MLSCNLFACSFASQTSSILHGSWHSFASISLGAMKMATMKVVRAKLVRTCSKIYRWENIPEKAQLRQINCSQPVGFNLLQQM